MRVLCVRVSCECITFESGVCESVVCMSVVYESVVCESVVFESVVCMRVVYIFKCNLNWDFVLDMYI